MKNITRSVGGTYDVKGKKYPMLIGTRAQVWHETAYKTSGGLTKNNLFKNKSGRIVSKSKYFSAKKEKRLLKHGYGYTKGKFVPSTHTKKHHKKRRGGATVPGEPLNSIGDAATDTAKQLGDATKETADKIGDATKEGFSKVSDATKEAMGNVSKTTSNIAKKTSSFFSNLFNMKKQPQQQGGRKSRKMRGGIYGQGTGNVASQAASWNSQKYGSDSSPGSLNLLATNYSGGRRRKMRGGIYGQGAGPLSSQSASWNSSKWGNDSSPGNLNLLATNYSGGRSRRRRRMRGGIYGQGSGNVASQAETWNSSKMGNDSSPGSLNLLATNYSGGRRTRRRKSRGGNPPIKGPTPVSQNAAPVKPTK